MLINKNRLHSFRKMSFNKLPIEDCHYIMRQKMVDWVRRNNPSIMEAPLCVSFAWDWYVLL